jgi:hypothetical protein
MPSQISRDGQALRPNKVPLPVSALAISRSFHPSYYGLSGRLGCAAMKRGKSERIELAGRTGRLAWRRISRKTDRVRQPVPFWGSEPSSRTSSRNRNLCWTGFADLFQCILETLSHRAWWRGAWRITGWRYFLRQILIGRLNHGNIIPGCVQIEHIENASYLALLNILRYDSPFPNFWLKNFKNEV